MDSGNSNKSMPYAQQTVKKEQNGQFSFMEIGKLNTFCQLQK
jgi:hypothetical protein